ncbi:uncharacterized protein EDB91DRAFT_1238979 [Suillus paluster]|uniref:uncharacterized protein n=1 Tax=Suillus paluster TaxID=48578 RepID=UPI001B879EDA|nr:uncharacterized protein EDB91DRAFT_1238979 [Suillus paluster]KAG1731224.1 hypothetical protein EDB91DRAFT_1238979 [Suillus paluster]
MRGSKVQEWTPTSNIHLVEWKKTVQTRKATGKWVERPKIRKIQSVLATPTKSSSKQWPSEDMLFLGGDDWVSNLNQQDFIPLPLPTSMSQNDYLQYLSILLEREAPADQSCIICRSNGVYKCHNCFSEPLFCTNCCRMEHQRLPFHRISQWTGSFFEDCCLVKTGLVISLGHSGNPCPCQDYGHATTPTANASKNNHDLPTGVPFIKNDKTMTTIVDKSGVHTHIIKYCMCADAPSADLQLFQLGLFPASFTQPKTAFTFDVLDDFLLDNLECGMSVMNYYSKLRRMTTNVFPHLVPDRYWELMRVARQWRQLKLLKWNGFGHKEKDVEPSDLALFCPACPQPGINVTLPTEEGAAEINRESDLEMLSWLYSRSLVMDGNFKAEHMHAANPIDEVPLMDGHGFMVGDGKYKAHLALAKDAIQRSKCNNHRAVNQANASRHRLEATGIGGCACARHGCFVPHAMVDFQKGERQINMDYALCEALKHNAGGIRCTLTFYDVNCQYNKYLKDRVADSPYLRIQEQMEIIPGIGLWHVHGHQDSCYVRYASNFIASTARIDSEIMETLWAPLNIISPSAWGMGTPHRKECLDYQMNDCNFMKMIRMSKALCQKFRQAVKGLADSREAFEKLDQSADENNVRDWGEQERLEQERRSTDPKAMDIYEVQLQKAPTRKEQELRLLEENGQQPAPARRRGVATWLAEGLSIEEAQVTLHMDIRRLGQHLTENQQLEIGQHHERLQGDIDHWLATDSDDETADEFRLFEPEKVVIPLPSNLGQGRCAELGTADMIHQEHVLREGQANDALHNIRVHLADKVVIFRKTVRTAKSQAKSTRAWAQIHAVDRAVSINASIYSKCWSQLGKLGAANILLNRYRPLLKEHLQVSTAVADPNARGQRNSMLAWFWSMDVEGDSDSSDWLNEFYRVHWLRAKALRDRWEEEMLLVQHEMNWTCNFFLHKAEQWILLATISKATNKVGHLAYAAR